MIAIRCLTAFLLMDGIANAQLVLTATSPSSSVQMCPAFSSQNQAYEKLQAIIERTKAMIVTAIPGSADYNNLTQALSNLQPVSDKLLASLQRYNAIEMATAQIQVDRNYQIPVERLGGANSNFAMKITPSSASQGSFSVPAETVQVVFYGAKFCSELTAAGGNLNSAVAALIQQLFVGL